MRRSPLFLLPLLLLINQLFSQTLAQQHFDHYTTANGLSHNSVTGLAQDETGYVWITTGYGLNRFNGSQFVQYHSTADSSSLVSDELWVGLNWLDKKRLAVPGGGLHLVNTRTGQTRNLFIPYHQKEFQFKFNMIVQVVGDAEGNMFILSRSGFYHYDSSYKLVHRFDYYSEKEVPVTHFFFGRGLFVLDENRLLITSIAGIFVYEKTKMRWRKMTAGDSPLLAEFLDYPKKDFLFFQDKPGTFFILKLQSDSLFYVNLHKNKKVISKSSFPVTGSQFGWRTKLAAAGDTLFHLTGHLSGFYKMSFNPVSGKLHLFPEKHLPAYLCNALLTDRDKNLWIGTNKGLFRENPQYRIVETVHLPESLETKYPNIRIEDLWTSSTTIYAAARGDAGLLLFNKKDLRLQEQIVFKEGNNIRTIVPLSSTHLLLGTLGPPVAFNLQTKKGTTFLPPQWAYPGDWTGDLHRDRQGKIWISSSNIYAYEPQKNKFDVIPGHPELLSVPYAIDEDLSGHIWMAGHGIARYNTALGRYDLLIDSLPYTKMPDKQVSAMAIDDENRIWFNSVNNGLIGYDIKRKIYYHITRKNGLPDDNIVAVIAIDKKLWVACYSGIACMDLQNFEIRSFGKEDGLPSLPVARGTHFYYDKEDQKLYLGISTALIRFSPQQMLQTQTTLKTFIESIVINGKKTLFLPDETFTATWKENEFLVTIGTINFTDSRRQRFAYRVVTNNAAPWIDIGSQPSFSISGLSPGRHRVQVKCYSTNNFWPEQIQEFNVTVLPPIWLQPWFLAFVAILVWLSVYLLIRWRTNVVRRKEMIKTQIEKLKADDYKNQFELEQVTNYFSSSLAGKKTEEEVLWDVSSNLIGRMNYEECIIYLWNKDKTKMVQKAAYGPKGRPEAITMNVFEVLPGQGIVGHVIESRQPVLVPDTRKDTRYRVDDDFRLSELCVPIIHNNELLGIIDSEHHQLNYFRERDVKMLTTIATLLGNKLKQLESEQSLEAKKIELANINEQLAEARLSALQAQMNPHFVFNALNSIKRMILDKEDEKASRYLSKFALMIRMTLEQSKEIFITLGDNIAYLKSYLEMEQLRFDDSFTYCICVDEKLDTCDTLVPSMMIQPIVENAIWHGLMQAQGEKKLSIGFAFCENKLCCTVEDNGVGIHQSEALKETQRPLHRSVGLENLQKRIKIMNDKYDFGGYLQISDIGDGEKTKSGTKVVLKFNLITT